MPKQENIDNFAVSNANTTNFCHKYENHKKLVRMKFFKLFHINDQDDVLRPCDRSLPPAIVSGRHKLSASTVFTI